MSNKENKTFTQRIKELDNQEEAIYKMWQSNFKDGIADSLIDGRRADNTTYAYKQGYDFGLWLHSKIEETNE